MRFVVQNSANTSVDVGLLRRRPCGGLVSPVIIMVRSHASVGNGDQAEKLMIARDGNDSSALAAWGSMAVLIWPPYKPRPNKVEKFCRPLGVACTYFGLSVGGALAGGARSGEGWMSPGGRGGTSACGGDEAGGGAETASFGVKSGESVPSPGGGGILNPPGLLPGGGSKGEPSGGAKLGMRISIWFGSVVGVWLL